MSVPRPRSSFSPSSSLTVKAPSAPEAQMYLDEQVQVTKQMADYNKTVRSDASSAKV